MFSSFHTADQHAGPNGDVLGNATLVNEQKIQNGLFPKFFGPIRVTTPKRHLDQFSHFAGLMPHFVYPNSTSTESDIFQDLQFMVVTNKQTGRQTDQHTPQCAPITTNAI